MASVTFYAVTPFRWNKQGLLEPGKAEEASCADIARARALQLAGASGNAGAAAFYRARDFGRSDLGPVVLIAAFGEVDLGALGR